MIGQNNDLVSTRAIVAVKALLAPLNPTASSFDGSSPGRLSFAPWKFVVLALLACAVLAARRPEGLLLPQFFAEDAAVFFADAYRLPFWESVTKPQAGYHNLAVRLCAEFATLFPLEAQPLVYNLISLLMAATAFSWIYLPQFRHIIHDDRHRLLLSLFFLILPNQESLMKLCYIQWYLLFWLILVSLMEPFGRWWRNAICVVIAWIVFWTAGISVILLPVLAIRTALARKWDERLHWGVMSCGAFSALAATMIVTLSPHATNSMDQPATPQVVATAILHGVSYKLIDATFIGMRETRKLHELCGWPAVYAVAAAIATTLSALLVWRERKGMRMAIPLTLLYIAAASAACLLVRTYALEDLARGSRMWNQDRYFFIPAYLVVMVAATLASDAMSDKSAPLAARRVAALAALSALLNLAGFHISWTPVDQKWPEQARLIRAAQDEADRTGTSRTLSLRVNPTWFNAPLTIEPRQEASISKQTKANGTAP